jgi:hypothetical protein
MRMKVTKTSCNQNDKNTGLRQTDQDQIEIEADVKARSGCI